ncbi:MAG: MerR family transcriptional regulator, heat shock protein HspR [Chloroflexota bacterium]|jgi:DNA-binding transcriptional MerR regulator|nr:MerR family transcriptional regulator, heat shock protein HspR [Chloroflexota bacterium]
MTDRPRQFYRLETAAALVRLPPARIRRYVRIGLVRPVRVAGRTAIFGDEELARLRKISRLGDHLGLNDAGIEVVLRLLDEIERLREAVDARSGAPDERA